jgi:uncharacterized membrane protein YkvA (DUF1232 family)
MPDHPHTRQIGVPNRKDLLGVSQKAKIARDLPRELRYPILPSRPPCDPSDYHCGERLGLTAALFGRWHLHYTTDRRKSQIAELPKREKPVIISLSPAKGGVMAKQENASGLSDKAGILAGIIKNARLVWRLLRDPDVPSSLKAIPPASLLYLLFPFDFLPDLALGLGQLDDIAIILLGLKLFIELCPQDIVRRHLREMSSVSGSYRVVDDEPSQKPSPSGYIDAPYRVIGEEEKE